jgi:hypothetical protein
MRIGQWEVRIVMARAAFWGVEKTDLVAGKAFHVSLWPQRIGFCVAMATV